MGEIEGRIEGLKRKPVANSTYKKLAVQWLNKALCFVSSFVLADSFVLQNPPPRQAAKPYCPQLYYTKL